MSDGSRPSEWAFPDDPETAAFTLHDIAHGKAPILQVTHDVGDGMWQFLDGQPVEVHRAVLVSLRELVAREPSLTELADLPLGWQATRSALGQLWTREPIVPLEWSELIQEAGDLINEMQSELQAEFQLAKYERFDLDQDDAAIVFSTGGVRKVEAAMCIVGTLSTTTHTWLWSWANNSIPPTAQGGIGWVTAFGQENKLKRLIEPTWPAEEADGWEMARVACMLLGAEGVYRVPYADGFIFLLLFDVHWVA